MDVRAKFPDFQVPWVNENFWAGVVILTTCSPLSLSVALVLAVLAAALQQSTADADLRQHEVGDSPGPSSTEDGPRLEVRAGRHARATCDLLSFQSKWVTPNHAGCAAHCLAMFKGFKGGYCKDAVCHCRK